MVGSKRAWRLVASAVTRHDGVAASCELSPVLRAEASIRRPRSESDGRRRLLRGAADVALPPFDQLLKHRQQVVAPDRQVVFLADRTGLIAAALDEAAPLQPPGGPGPEIRREPPGPPGENPEPV